MGKKIIQFSNQFQFSLYFCLFICFISMHYNLFASKHHKLMKLRKILFISIFMVCIMSQLIVYKQSSNQLSNSIKSIDSETSTSESSNEKDIQTSVFFHRLNSHISDMIDINFERHTKNRWPDAFKQNKKESKCSWDKIFQTPNANQYCDVAYDFKRYFKESRLKLLYANSSFIK